MESETANAAPDGTEQEPADSLARLSLYPYQLDDVRLWEVQVERGVGTEEEETDDQLPLNLEISIASMPSGFTARLRASLESLTEDHQLRYRLSAAMEGIFVPRDESVVAPTEEEYLTAVGPLALTALWPYVYELVHSLQQRMQVPYRRLPVLEYSSFPNELVRVPAQDEDEPPEDA